MTPRPPLARPLSRDDVADRLRRGAPAPGEGQAAIYGRIYAATDISDAPSAGRLQVVTIVGTRRRGVLSITTPHDAGMAVRTIRDILWGKS